MKILELAFQDNLDPKRVASTNGGEYHSPCPACGGNDRFIIWPSQNRYYCRQCEKSGDVIQYFRDFHGLSFREACLKANVIPKPQIITKFKKSKIFEPLKRIESKLKWKEEALVFVNKCHQNLLATHEALSLLKKRGFSLDSIKKFRLGWNLETTWGNWLAEEKNRKIWLPKGIVIPSFDNREVSKIKIRRSDWNSNDKLPKYVEVHGSTSGPIIYNLNHNLPIIVLESEFDALLIQQEAENICSSIALGGVTKKPDSYIHSLLTQAPLILFSLDYDEAGTKAYKWWKNHYKKLFIWPAPFEKSVGDAFIKGLDTKRWLSLGINEYSKINKNKE